LIGPETNNAVILVNRLLARGVNVHRADCWTDIDDRRFPPGSYLVRSPKASLVDDLSRRCSVTVVGATVASMHRFRLLRRPRIGLYRSWRPSSTDEGWARFVLEQFDFRYETLRDADLKQGTLTARFDAIVLPHQPERDIFEGNSPVEYPLEHAGGIGEAGVANLRKFADGGGTLIALDGACDFAIRRLSLPVTNVLEGVRPQAFSAPGSLLRISVDADHPIGWGYDREAAVMFVSSPAFEVRGAAQVVAGYPRSNQLLSGWLHGAELIAGRAAIVDVPLGLGRVILIGFRPHFRAQMRATYRFLFNAIYYSVPGPGSPHVES
jgi:hypothetical protein